MTRFRFPAPIRVRVLAGAVVLGLLASACGGGDDPEETTGAAETTATTAASETSVATDAPATTTAGPVAVDLSTKPVVTIPGGEAPAQLVINDVVVGDGDEAVAGDKVEVHYVGVLFDDGAQFDASWDRGSTFEFTIGAQQVIQGWDQGVAGMRVGGRRELTIPSLLAYGDRSPSPAIPAGSTLIFVVDLVSIVPPFPEPQPTDAGVLIPNQGGDFEGNMPWSDVTAGPGLFAGDELNAAFPSDEGIEIYVTFAISGVEIPADAGIVNASLTSRAMQQAGTPFVDLGALTAAPVAYDTFPPSAAEREPTGPATMCQAFVDEGRLSCDVTEMLLDALDAGEERISFRLRFEEASNADGEADVAVFFFRDPNMNERGIFALEIEFG